MQRPKTLLSYLKKPSPEDQSSGDNTINGREFLSKNAVPIDLKEEVLGTETPPEKVPLPFNNGHKSSVFSSIKHKFSREKPRNIAKGDPCKISSVWTKNEGSDGLGNASVSLQSGTNRSFVSSNGNSNQEGKGLVSLILSDDHGFGPETPSMQPYVPGLKRDQDNICSSGDRSDCFSLNASKRIKSLKGLNFERKNLEEEFEMTSKFEWLHPSQIKDANGRRRGDPLYDKQTLYIPPDALRKMSASQKQYWDVKCKYIDIVLFFKVGKFYELYELDAEIGHKELDWKMTQSPAAPLLSPVQPGADFVDPAEVKNFLDLKGYFKRSCNKWDHTFDGENHDVALCALGILVNHLERLMMRSYIMVLFCHMKSIRVASEWMDRHLSILKSSTIMPMGTLYMYLDNCVTLPGKRLLRKWICHPLKDVEKINHRLDVVDKLVNNSDATLSTAQYLRKLPDLDRLLGRVKASIQSSEALLLPLIGAKILKQRVKVFGLLVKGLRIGLDLLRLLQKECLTSSLAKVVSLPVLDGDNGLDKFLTQFEAAIDSDFPNFQDHNGTDFDAETLSILMELFIEKATEWSQFIYAISCVDVLRSFSITAKFSSGVMCRPVILPLSKPSNFCNETGGPTLNIKGLWHPYALGESGGLPVPNNLHLGGNTNIRYPRSLLLTGPNMGGKSTLLRATCLAVIMAQLGCYVPGETCVLSLVDIIFTRLGATDRIMTGESTFFIECTETASVLQDATYNSLVLLDELGRGTSTFDGYAIAYAVFRHLVEMVNCRLLFATHYHPLTKEFASHPHVTLQHMACSFKLKSQSLSPTEQELVFLYRLTSGACPESYGMQVALMAGIPKTVVESASNAGQVMKKMNGESFKSCEQRANFSTLHEQWFTALLDISKMDGGFDNDNDNDLFDTLFCLWHELKADRSTC
ncbi:hypothetical protein H5410_036594 [Solanum commersonii]|uniref:DNA mismatch repair proteins mutS family domain-containing protein n=1 Tax=Solanum commersonii TaxID=4109 RepID=A0A9J5Y5R2_SOLCO|nr:hypothetical protein H5410_036594 [Solanum commersonii]